MLWVQGGFSFLLWVGYGIFQSQRSESIRAFVGAIPRVRRGVLGASLFLVGAMVLLGGLAITLSLGGFTSSAMTPLGWVTITALGLAFVHAQTMGTAMLVSLVQENVTKERASASVNRAPGDQVQP